MKKHKEHKRRDLRKRAKKAKREREESRQGWTVSQTKTENDMASFFFFFFSASLSHYRRWQGVTICWVQTDSSLLQLYCRAGLNTGFSGHSISPLPLFYPSTETSLNFLHTKPTRNVKLSGVQGRLRLYCDLRSTCQISVWILNHCKDLSTSHIDITSLSVPV